MVRKIRCGYSFSKLEQAEHFETKIEEILVKFSVLQQNRIIYSNAAKYFIKRVV